MIKQEQINRLLELGYSSRDMYLLKYEKDRVENLAKPKHSVTPITNKRD